MASLTSSSSRYRFTSDFYADLLWWHHFLVVFNGMCLFLDSKAYGGGPDLMLAMRLLGFTLVVTGCITTSLLNQKP